MPSSLIKAYGKSWGGSELIQKPVQNLGAPIEEEITRIAKPIYTHKPQSRREPVKYVFEIHIDQQDCHLLCLFIGVFTLSILMNRNKLPVSS